MADLSWLGGEIDVRPLFGQQQAEFLTLLRHLDTDEWQRPTGCPGWTVKDIAAHVLGDHIGRLSIARDRHHVHHPRTGESFPRFLDRINDEWVIAARRISPPVLIDLLAHTADQIADHWKRADMGDRGLPVTWAGADPAPMWLDAARDYSEYWTHHQQISEAVGRTGLTHPDYLAPVINTFLRALPHTLRDVDAPAGNTLEVTVTGPAGAICTCTRSTGRWCLLYQSHPRPDARLALDADTTWRLCTRQIAPEQASRPARIEGDHKLATTALNLVSIVWAPSDPEGPT